MPYSKLTTEEKQGEINEIIKRIYLFCNNGRVRKTFKSSDLSYMQFCPTCKVLMYSYNHLDFIRCPHCGYESVRKINGFNPRRIGNLLCDKIMRYGFISIQNRNRTKAIRYQVDKKKLGSWIKNNNIIGW